MRKINVKINDDKTVDLSQEVVGYVEESKATQIVVTLNTELQSSEINYHIVNFRHGENDEKLVSQKIYNLDDGDEESDAYKVGDKISLVLPQYVTRYPVVYAQVEGHILKKNADTGTKEIDTIIKSPVFLMKLDESIVGESGEFNTKVEGIFAEICKLESKFGSADEIIEKLGDGIDWGDIEENSRPRIINGEGYNSTVIGDIESSQAFGEYSVAIGKNLFAYGNNCMIVGKNGFSVEGVIFAVANGTEMNPGTIFEVAQEEANFHVKLHGITPESTASEDAIPTIKWIKDYVGTGGNGSGGDTDYSSAISELRSDIAGVRNDLSEGLDQASNEVLEVRDSLQSQIYTNKPLVSNPLVLIQSGWVKNENGKYTQTVLSNINTDRRNEIDVEIDSIEEWGDCYVLAVSESSNSLVFEAKSLPSKNLSFRITSTEVNYAV